MGYLLSISGIDGAGKSTQVALILKYFHKNKIKVHAGESMFTYFILKPVVNILRKATNTEGVGPVKRNRSLLPKFWFIPAFIDIWIAYIFKVYPLLKKYDVVLADRFYIDIWANLLYYGYVPKWAFEHMIKFLPKADIALIVEVNPKVVLKREKEFESDYYWEQAKIYKHLSQLIKCHIINANHEPKIVFKDIQSVLKSFANQT